MSEMTIGKKLMLGFLAMLVTALGLGGELKVATDFTAKKMFLVSQLQGDLFTMRGSKRRDLVFSGTASREAATIWKLGSAREVSPTRSETSS